MKILVSAATVADAPAIRKIWEEARRFKLSRGDEAWGGEPFTMGETESAIADGGVYLATCAGVPAVVVIIKWQDSRIWGEDGSDEQAGYIHRLAVAEAFRGQHIGEDLLRWACDHIAASGRRYARLDCSPGNESLCVYYERRGFKPTAHTALGNYTACLYQLELDPAAAPSLLPKA